MTFELHDLLWLLPLLLPLAVVSGWYAARREQAGRERVRGLGLSSDYFRGINFLLNEQPDKAIEVFVRMLEVNSETVETHLALGSLFRRRGEVERAIRIHQNLIARPSLDKAQRAQALCELALDYQGAGLLDRAENLFLELAEIPAHAEQALRSLMHIYEQEKDWAKALAVGRRLARIANGRVAPVLAQYCCELAERALADDDVGRAQGHINDAFALEPECIRAALLSGRLARRAGRDRDAIAAWRRAVQQEPAMLDETIDDIAEAYRHLGDDAGLRDFLAMATRQRVGLRTLQVVVDSIRSREGDEAAEAFLVERLGSLPSVPGLKALIDLQLTQPAQPPRDDLAVLKAVLDRLVADQQGYQCSQCGFRAQARHWQCPACHSWATTRPRRMIDIAPAVAPVAQSARVLGLRKQRS
jgi:lipopolysaccharide biosynthesis regulator YciM